MLYKYWTIGKRDSLRLSVYFLLVIRWNVIYEDNFTQYMVSMIKPVSLSKLTLKIIITVNLRVLVEKFTPRIVYVKSGVDFYAQIVSFHRKSHEICDR